MKMTEQEWDRFAYKWARLLDINYYHASADIEQFRSNLGDQGAINKINEIISANSAKATEVLLFVNGDGELQ